MKSLIIVLGVVALAACSRNEDKQEKTDIQPPKGMKVKVEGGLNVPVLEELDTLNPPVLTFKDTIYDFGSVDEGDVVKHVFEFENTGSSPLIIVDASSSCGCTIPSVSQEPVLPGETGKVKVRFDSKNKSGNISKKIRVSANTYPEPITTVILKGHVKS